MKALHKIERTGNVVHLMQVDSSSIPNTYIISTSSFFKMLGMVRREYSNALAKEIDDILRHDFEWLKLMSVDSSYQPRTGRTRRKMILRDILSQKEYVVLFKRSTDVEESLRESA